MAERGRRPSKLSKLGRSKKEVGEVDDDDDVIVSSPRKRNSLFE